MQEQNTIFRIEQKVLEHAQAVRDDKQYKESLLMPEFTELLESYERMYKQFRSLIKISDTQQSRLNELNKQLTQLNMSKDKFFSIISHDLRGPLGSVIGLAESLQKHIETDAEKDDISKLSNQVYSSAKNLYALLENLLTWSRLQRGIEYRPEYLEIDEIIRFNMELFTSQIDRKKITLKNFVTCDITVYADYNAISTVFRNIISNAIKFTPYGGIVKIFARKHNETTVELVITDTGVGIHKERISDLFRIDVQYSKPGTDGETGTGLGLMLCKELLDKSGGKIWIENNIDAGTTVRFTLPGILSEDKSQSVPSDVLVPELSNPADADIHLKYCIISKDIIISDKIRKCMPEVVNKLEREIIPRWKELREVFFIDDIRDFASETKQFALEHHLEFLADYSRNLYKYAQKNDIFGIENHIGQFIEIINKSIKIKLTD